MKTLVVNFSGKISVGNGESIGRFICDASCHAPQLINYRDLRIHACSCCNYECFLDNNHCRYITDDLVALYDSILCADKVFFIIPVYSDYPCSNYFSFRERSQCYFDETSFEKYQNLNIKFVVIANNGFENTVQVIHSDFPLLDDKTILQLSSERYNTKSINGDLLQYDDVRERILGFMDDCS
jgi:multimeric flavodoxin WrbA